jgi:hypothetical protein
VFSDGWCTEMRRGRSTRQRGAAMVEAAVMMPTLLILLLGVLHVRRAGAARLESIGIARSCAIEYGFNGCRNVPEGCADVLRPGRPEPDDTIAAQVDEGLLGGLGRVSSKFGSLATFPVLGAALQVLFGERSTASVERTFKGHLPGDERMRKVHGSFTLVCNVSPRESRGIVQELYDALNVFKN